MTNLDIIAENRKRDWLLVSETFLTHQGEGPSSGQLANFIRLGACNLHCSFCDTPYTWAFSDRLAGFHHSGRQYEAGLELRRVKIDELAEMILLQPGLLNVITGGEPMLQGETIGQLISLVNETPHMQRFEIETAGTISPHSLRAFENVSFNVSPKLANSGNPLSLRRAPSALAEFVKYGAIFKFVITAATMNADITEVTEIVESVRIPEHRVWLMPEGTDAATVTAGLQNLAKIALVRGWNVTSRDHVLIYGNKRGH